MRLDTILGKSPALFNKGLLLVNINHMYFCCPKSGPNLGLLKLGTNMLHTISIKLLVKLTYFKVENLHFVGEAASQVKNSEKVVR